VQVARPDPTKLLYTEGLGIYLTVRIKIFAAFERYGSHKIPLAQWISRATGEFPILCLTIERECVHNARRVVL